MKMRSNAEDNDTRTPVQGSGTCVMRKESCVSMEGVMRLRRSAADVGTDTMYSIKVGAA